MAHFPAGAFSRLLGEPVVEPKTPEVVPDDPTNPDWDPEGPPMRGCGLCPHTDEDPGNLCDPIRIG